MRASLAAGWATLLAVLLWSAPVHAVLISNEPFGYSSIGPASVDLLGKNGGTGWGSPWKAGAFNASITTNYDIGSGSLVLPGNNYSTGNRTTSTQPQTGISGLIRDFDSPIPSTATQTMWLSVLLRPENPVNQGAFNGFFGIYLRGSLTDVFIGKPGGGSLFNYVVEERGGGSQLVGSGSASVAANQIKQLVMRVDLTPGADLFRLAVNPATPISTLQPGLNLNIGNVLGVAVYSSGAHSVDEIRWGTTFADVIPEPSSIWLTVAGLAGAVCWAWRKRVPG
ncbi:MAG: PEP-CTERM sorting domain-containing protein [Pirellulales bacterium]|nr:PEP-CTERM sorting domain-containing protein [Pirellulales bacterium]